MLQRVFHFCCTVPVISILPPQKGLEFPGGGGSVRPKNLKKCMKLNRNFQRGGGGGGGSYKKIPSGGMDIFWNHTLCTTLNRSRSQTL